MDTTPKVLDANEPQKVSYVVPLWVRDEQIRVNIPRIAARIEGYTEGQKRNDRIAIVCFGPSLNDTWEQLREFKYIITCSGSHKFLVERGIIPTWHVEVDPQPHKVDLVGPPHKDVEYLIASCCSPKLLDHLEGFNVKLWHVFTNEAEALRVLPQGEWAITGGPSVGLRAMGIARFFGFWNQHIFGMDGSEGASGKHAAAHPRQAKTYNLTTYKGIEYKTTPAMLECARQTWHELDQMPDVRATFYGEGLVQAMAVDHKYKPIDKTRGYTVAITKPELITPEFRELNAKLHRENIAYGVGAGRHAPTVLKLYESTSSKSVLDYGCGKGYLQKSIPFPIWEYDPAIPGKEESPRPADLVCCLDVLEHIEPDKLRFVLDDLARCVKKVGYFVIHMGPAKKTYADGRNTHLIQQDEKWWRKQLEKHFEVGAVLPVEKLSELHVVVAPKKAG